MKEVAIIQKRLMTKNVMDWKNRREKAKLYLDHSLPPGGAFPWMLGIIGPVRPWRVEEGKKGINHSYRAVIPLE